MRKHNFVTLMQLATLALTLSTVARAQVTIQKGKADVSEEKVNVLYDTSFRVVAQEFHLADPSSFRVPITLVLGESKEGVSGDELNKVYVIYLDRWDDAKFALATSRIALQHLISEQRKNKIVNEIVRRANQIAPVSLQAARDQPGKSSFR